MGKAPTKEEVQESYRLYREDKYESDYSLEANTKTKEMTYRIFSVAMDDKTREIATYESSHLEDKGEMMLRNMQTLKEDYPDLKPLFDKLVVIHRVI